MIYQLPAVDQPVDQGDIIDGCPILQVALFDPQDAAAPKVACSIARVVVLTQTCDLRQLHTVPTEVLKTLCQLGQRKARIQPPYREHLAKHFADTYSRIGLPLPYETL